MSSGAARWVGAVCLALLAAASLYWLAYHRRASDAKSPAPVATPPGITLQLRAASGRSSRPADARVIYADAKGMTLYVFDKDRARGKSTCSAACARLWPPAVAPPDATPDGDWSLADRADGTRQWAYRGAPLYRFSNDQAIGDAKGDGAEGGSWHVAAFRPGAGMALPDAIEVREIADAGGVGLVDSLGMTLYVLDGDARFSDASCASGSDCARHWVPLQAPEIANPTGDFAVIARDDGITQWTYRHKALYEFDGDRRAGDANGIAAGFRVALIARHFMPANVRIRRSVELGQILTTASGATLYERDRPLSNEIHIFRESHGPPALGRSLGTATCDADCTKTWPPFIAPADSLPCGYWDIVTRPDGRRQWVYKGYALYTYALDQPGESRANELYDLEPIGNDAGAATSAARVPPGGDVAGIGVGAMFWHAVVP